MACTPIFSTTPTPDNSAPAVSAIIPSGFVSGATVELTGGVAYSGTLILTGLSNVTVKQVGTGNTYIRPGPGFNGINASGALSCRIGTISSDGSSAIRIMNCSAGVVLNGASGCSVNRVDIFNCSGSYGIRLTNTNFCTVKRCYLISSSCIGVIGGDGFVRNVTITENTIRFNTRATNTRGMGVAIQTGSSNTITSNLVENMAYMGLNVLAPQTTTISCNEVNDCNNGTDKDAGAIYAWWQNSSIDGITVVGCHISSNLVTRCESHGIYLDDQLFDTTVQRNTIRSCSGAAINFHRAYLNTVLSNSCVVVATNAKGLNFGADLNGEMYNNVIEHNVIRCADAVTLMMELQFSSDWRGYGLFANNYFFGREAAIFRENGANWTWAEWLTKLSAAGQNSATTFNITVGPLLSVTDEGSGTATATASAGPSTLGINRQMRMYLY